MNEPNEDLHKTVWEIIDSAPFYEKLAVHNTKHIRDYIESYEFSNKVISIIKGTIKEVQSWTKYANVVVIFLASLVVSLSMYLFNQTIDSVKSTVSSLESSTSSLHDTVIRLEKMTEIHERELERLRNQLQK